MLPHAKDKKYDGTTTRPTCQCAAVTEAADEQETRVFLVVGVSCGGFAA